MADQKRWFKVWTSILLDPAMVSMSLEDTGRWVRLGALTVSVGDHGTLEFPPGAKGLLGVLDVPSLACAKEALQRLPGMSFEEGKNRYGGISVTFQNWRKYQEDSTVAERMKTLRSRRRGEEIRGEKNKKDPPVVPPSLAAPKDWSTAPWPSPEALAYLYNTTTPDYVPAVESLSAKRRARAAAMLRQFPDRAWWEDVFREYELSPFLAGRTAPRPGHEKFKPHFDWLLSNGQNGGTENCVKVHDGNYRR